MTKEQLKQKLQYLTVEQIEKSLSVYVTTPTTGLQLFNIEDDHLPDLLQMFIKSVVETLVVDDIYTLEDYSTSLKRVDAYYRYDLPVGTRTEEMQRMTEVLALEDRNLFDSSVTPIESINGLFVVIRGNLDQNVVIYKNITAVDKTYAGSSYLLYGTSNTRFSRQSKSMLRITPALHMLLVGEEIILVDMKKLESKLHLDNILKRETERDIASISAKNIVVNDVQLKKACQTTSMCKKLRHALTKSKVVEKNVSNADIIAFAQTERLGLKFHFNRAKDKFEIKSKAEAIRFIKLLDDDYLWSELTKEDYDSPDKDPMNAE